MLFNLLAPLSDELNPLNVFRYQTFRAGSAILFAFFLTLLIGPRIIAWLKIKQREGQPIREDGPESHLLTKKGTPTMGGLMFLISACVTTILWADVGNPYVWVVLMVTIGYGAIGFGDDFLKLTKRNTKGLPGRAKLLIQGAIGLLAAYFAMLSVVHTGAPGVLNRAFTGGSIGEPQRNPVQIGKSGLPCSNSIHTSVPRGGTTYAPMLGPA